ncbi:MAG: DUF853 domain-containing protein [Fusobacteriaceae bacterium]|jgi:DNA helicase HerA-like ATPase|nr:DUF853 domain-containing protein [Fusobacteriaceae bacterium]
MVYENKIWMAYDNGEKLCLLPSMGNRHGLIAGATGTGKTITLKVMAEAFSDLGVPVFLADVKGDLAGMCLPGEDNEGMQKRIAKYEIENFKFEKKPTCFWDLYAKNGHPIRTTVSEMGPTLLARILDLNDIQEAILYIIFRIADDNGWMLLDLKDLRAMLNYVNDNSSKFTVDYGTINKQSVGIISRALLTLEDNGGTKFFGEPALNINDWMRVDENGKGMINILDSQKLVNSPRLYAIFLLWMLTELFERLPEMGDVHKPKLVFFFDEAHLLFSNCPKALLDKIDQVVKLIRSKGVGVYFITQNPADIPDSVLAQLGNKIQHALRAYTPNEMKAVRVAADSFRPNPAFATDKVISEMGIGEALVSFLDEKGVPGVVRRAFILPPQSKMGTIDDFERKEVIFRSPMGSKYDEMIDRESAYEILTKRYSEAASAKEDEKQRKEEEKKRVEDEKAAKIAETERLKREKEETKERLRLEKEEEKERIRREKEAAKPGTFEKILTSAGRTATSTATRAVTTKILRGVLGTLLGGKK